jgi:hypothetical protein
MKRETQRELIEILLKENEETYKPVYWFIGERYSKTLGKYVFLSHRGPARLTELYQDRIAERRMVKGKSGARYYEYRIRQEIINN